MTSSKLTPRSLLTLAILAFPFLTSAPARLGAMARDVGDFSEEGVSSARAAVKKDPADVNALTQLGKLLTRKYDATEDTGVRDEAESALDRALEIDPKHAEAVAWKGALKGLMARAREDKALAKEALADLDRAVKLDPDNLAVVYTNATVSVEVPMDWGRLDEGARRMERIEKELLGDPSKAATYDINLANVYYKLGKVHQERRDFAKAISYWEKALQVGPETRLGKKSQRMIERYKSGSGGKREGGWKPPRSR